MKKVKKLIFPVLLVGSLFAADTKEYEKDLKLDFALTQLGSTSDRGLLVGITNNSKTDHNISVLENFTKSNCGLYISFSGFMDNGTGKWEKLPCKYREAKPADFKIGTKSFLLEKGKHVDLFSMMLSPKQMFLLSGVGASVKLVAHYKFVKRNPADPISQSEMEIPAFVLNSDTIIFNMPK